MESLCQLVALSLQQSGVEFCSVPFPLLRGACSCWMCQNSNRHRVWVWGWESITLALDKSIWWPDVNTCSATTETSTSTFLSALRCFPRHCSRGPSSLADVTPRALVTRDGVDHPLSPQFWNRVLGVDQLLPECQKWTKSDSDVQVAEHSADGLGQPVDIWDGYGCSCCLPHLYLTWPSPSVIHPVLIQ